MAKTKKHQCKIYKSGLLDDLMEQTRLFIERLQDGKRAATVITTYCSFCEKKM